MGVAEGETLYKGGCLARRIDFHVRLDTWNQSER
jgi:hypothetical protein